MSKSSQRQPRYYYIITVLLLSLLAVSLFYLLSQEDDHYAILIGQYATLERAEKEFSAVNNLLTDTTFDYIRIETFKDFKTIQIGKFEQKAATDKIKQRLYGAKHFKAAELVSAYIKNGKIFEVFRDVTPPPVEPLKQSETEQIVLEIVEEKPRELRYGSFDYFPEEYLSQIEGQSFYTIQLTSSTDQKDAFKEFNRVVEYFSPDRINWLRVEHVQKYHTVRVGKFLTMSGAEPIYKELVKRYSNAQILKAYIKAERIGRIYLPQLLIKVLPDVKQLGAIGKTKNVTQDELGAPKTRLVSQDIPLGEHEEFFTVQLLSFSQLPPALREYDRIVENKDHATLDHLRIEEINNYFTIRSGKFDSRQEALTLKKFFIGNGYKDAFVISAYIIPSRIRKMFSAIALPLVKEDKIVQPDKEEILISPSSDIMQELTKAIPEEKPEEGEVVQLPEVAPSPPVVEAEPAKVTFLYEVLTILNKDDKGENLRMPSALFFDASTGELYIINGANNRVVVYGSDYFPQNSLGKGRGLDSPLSGALDKKGNVFVAQAGTPSSPTRLTVLNAAFLPVREIFLEGIPDSDDFIFQRVAVSKSGLLYATGLKSDKVLVLDSSGSFKKWFYVPVDKRKNYVFVDVASEAEIKAVIKDIIVDSEGNLFLLSEENSRVYVFDPDQNFLFSFGTKGGAPGKMSRPRGLAIDEKKRCFYLVDYMRHTILVYDFTGAFRFEFGGRGWGPEWFNYPVDIELGPQGQVIVADFFNQRVQVFETHFSGPMPLKPQDLWTFSAK